MSNTYVQEQVWWATRTSTREVRGVRRHPFPKSTGEEGRESEAGIWTTLQLKHRMTCYSGFQISVYLTSTPSFKFLLGSLQETVNILRELLYRE